MGELSFMAQAVVLFLSQVVFIYFRTINVTAQMKSDRFMLFWTGSAVHVTWLLGTSLGVNAILSGNYWLVLFSLSGGLLGADFGIKKQIKNEERSDNRK